MRRQTSLLRKAIFFLTFSFSSVFAADYKDFPVYNEVVKTFFATYSHGELKETEGFRFEKRPDGWHSVIYDLYEAETRIKDELFWDLATRQYLAKLNYPGKADYVNREEEYLARYDKKYFSICPYYGYPGWDWDVIMDYKDRVGLPDSIMYGIGRAYSSYSFNLLDNNSGTSLKEHRFVLPIGKNALTEEQLEKYRFYSHRGIECFKKVKEMNPKFETVVGEIGLKLSHEYVSAFLNLRVFQNEEEAKKELDGCSYDEFYVSLAKNFLSCCPKDAVLFTNGDTDTYPLLYVQSALNFRPDVLVVNLSLLQTARYIDALREKILSAQPAPLSFTKAQTAERNFDVVLLRSEKEESMDLIAALDFVKTESNRIEVEGSAYPYFPVKNLSLRVEDKIMNWKLEKNYLLKSDLMVLDFIASTRLTRPICFTITTGEESFCGLSSYLHHRGLVYGLLNKKNGESAYLPSSIPDTKLVFDNLLNKFSYEGVKNVTGNKARLISNYRIQFIYLAEALAEKKQLDSAKKVLGKCLELFPNESSPFLMESAQIVAGYYKMKSFAAGNKIAKVVIKNCKDPALRWDCNGGDCYDEADRMKKTLRYLRDYAIQYKQSEIADLLKDIDED